MLPTVLPDQGTNPVLAVYADRQKVRQYDRKTKTSLPHGNLQTPAILPDPGIIPVLVVICLYRCTEKQTDRP